MPSRNSINKPKDKIHKNSHASSIGKRRSSRVKSTTRSSTSRYNDDAVAKPTESKAIALYTGKVVNNASVTNKTLSNKRAKKLERNKKYVESRLQKDLEQGMEVDQPSKSMIKVKKPQSETEKVRKLLWETVNSNDLSAFKVLPNGEGTIVGVQSF